MTNVRDPPLPKVAQKVAQLEAHLQSRLSGRVYDLRLFVRDNSLVLRGRAHPSYAKQLAQHVVMQATGLPIRANEIEVP